MHANVAEEVVYSGEFTFIKDTTNGIWFLVIDNNSGTYSPNKLLLPKLKLLFERNFVGLRVEVCSFDEPICKEYKEIVTSSVKTRTSAHWKG
jgi:hypothetical protein